MALSGKPGNGLNNISTGRGLTQTVSIPLLIMVTLSMMGIFYMGISEFGKETVKQSENQTESFGNVMGTDLSIESATGTGIYIRNSGVVSIPNNSIALYIDEVFTPCNVSGSIEPGKIGVLEIETITYGYHTIKVSAGSASDITRIMVYSSLMPTTTV